MVGRDPGGDKLLLLCLSKTDGKILWERELDQGNKLYRKDNNASPSPVTNGTHVCAVTGTGVVKAFDMEGVEIWHKSLKDDYGAFGLGFGYASSPLLHDGKLILEVLHGRRTDAPSYIVAFNATTGEKLWHHERETDAVSESPDAYTTPTLVESNGKTQIVISGADYVTGHDSETGKEIWRAAGLNPERRGNYRIVGSPLVVDGMVYAPTRKKPLLALRTGGTGDVTESHLVWKWEGAGAPDVPTPVCDGKYFYMVDDRGMVTCLDAKTGELIWGPERTAQGVVSSSPSSPTKNCTSSMRTALPQSSRRAPNSKFWQPTNSTAATPCHPPPLLTITCSYAPGHTYTVSERGKLGVWFSICS